MLINASPFPLIGLGLLHVAASLDPRDPLLAQRRGFAARLAVAAALGYLLLAPLLAAANLQRQHSQALASSGELRRATEQLKQMRQVLNTATSVSELEQRLAAVEGPRLDAADRSLPLPLLRSRIAALLDQATTRLERARSADPPTSPWTLLGEIARTSGACLAQAVGFAALAWRPGSELSLLEGLKMGWEHLRYRRGVLRGRSGRTSTDADYLRQIGGAEDGEDGSQR